MFIPESRVRVAKVLLSNPYNVYFFAQDKII